MYAVAVIELATAPEVEAAALAAELGGAPYEHRLRLVGGSPAIALRTADRELALRTLAGLRARGHGAVACDESAVFSSDKMLSMRNFRFEATPDNAVYAGEPQPERLLGSEILALLRAVHKTDLETTTEVRVKQFSAGRAVMTGGLVLSKNVKREQRSSASDAQQVLYVFRNSGERPWLLRERSANYATLGAELAPSSLQNFVTTLRRLRELAPAAAYDERLTKLRPAAGPSVARAPGSQSIVSTTASAIDLAAHLLALWFRGKR